MNLDRSHRLVWRGRVRPAFAWLTALILLIAALPTGTAMAQGAWYAEYFGDSTLSGSPILTRYEDRIDHDWGGGAPGAGVPADNFSARWTRSEWFDSGTYRFWARADDGFRLWVGDQLVIDAWYDQQGGWVTRDFYLGSGTYQVRAEYYEHQGGALVTLNWERISGGQGWLAAYYANQDLSGAPALERTETAIDFAWGYGSPSGSSAAVPADRFSARWSRSLGFAAGTYRFFTSTDDGVRLWVDNQLLIDAWHNQSLPNTHWGDVYLTQGIHHIRVEYFEDGGEAQAHVWWQLIGSEFSRWKGEYFDNTGLVGGPALVRDDAEIAFDWGTGAPASWMPADQFGVRWTRQMSFNPGYYRFSSQSDDGVRVWLDGGLVIDKWQAMENELHYVDGIYLSGPHQLKVEYLELGGSARVRFWISPAGEAQEPSPPASAPGTVVVDNDDAGFVTGGSEGAWHTASAGYGAHLRWTRNNDTFRPDYNWGQWYPELTSGRYEVYVYIPPQYATVTNARYWIWHADGVSMETVNQAIYFGEWVSLGVYDFDGADNERVSLSDITYEPYLSRMIAFDAVKWVPR